MHNQPFDLSQLDYKAVRKQKRRKLLLYSAAPVAIVFLVAMWFILPRILTHKAIGDYKAGNFTGARRWLTPLTITSPEPFVIAFNSGTVDTRLGKYERAEKELTRAVAIAPKDKVCMAAQNLVLSMKTHAESLKDEKIIKELEVKTNLVIKEHPECFQGSASSGGGGGSSSAAQSQSPSDAQQQQLEQKEQEGRERQSKYASEESYDPNNPELKPW